jgi:peptidoglycan/xylan/chitin deacetylase (PgdA/CDA1 family)
MTKSVFIKLFFSLLILSSRIYAQYGEVDVKLWEDDKKSAYTFTLDDGLASQVNYGSSVLESFNFRGTFFVIADHLNEVLPGQWRYTAWSELRDLNSSGHEIASHSLNHPDLTQLPLGDTITPGTALYEIYQSRERVNQKIPGQTCFSFAYPLSAFNDTILEYTSQFYEAARGAGYDHNASDPGDYEFHKIKSIAPLFDMPRNVLDDDLPELEYHKTLIDSSIKYNGWMLSMLHEIVPQAQLQEVINIGLWHPISSEWFALLAGWLKQKSESGEVWVASMKDVSIYIKERSTFSSEVIYQDQTEIRLVAADQQDDLIYTYPLTVDITVPGNWEQVQVIQGSRITSAGVFESQGKFYIRTKIIPDGGEILILKQDTAGTFNISGTINYYKTGEPVNNVIVIAHGANSFQASGLSNNEGIFSIANIPPGNYSVELNKADELSGVNATDALLVLKNTSGTGTLDYIQTKAADVDQSAIIDTTDSDLILKRFIRIIDHFEVTDWLFFPENQEVTIIDENINLECTAIKAGDVSP